MQGELGNQRRLSTCRRQSFAEASVAAVRGEDKPKLQDAFQDYVLSACCEDEYNVANMMTEEYLHTVEKHPKTKGPKLETIFDTETENVTVIAKNGHGHLNTTQSMIPIMVPEDDNQSRKSTKGSWCRGHLCRSRKCPFQGPRGRLARYITIGLLFVIGYGVLWSIFGEAALPKGYMFDMIVVTVAAWIGGEFTKKIELPPLLGMLIVGFALRNIPYVNIGLNIPLKWSSTVRNAALAIILARAGMGMDIVKLKKLGWVCVRLGALPCIGEIIGGAVAVNLLLGMPWIWAFLLGSVLSGLAPAMVVPTMLKLQQQGLGVDKGIPTLAVAMVSIGDALAVAAFGIVYGVTFAEGSITMTILQGPLEVLMGVAYGLVFGILHWYLPHKDANNVVLYRFLAMITSTLFAIFGSLATGYGGAGAIACLIYAFVAAHGWRKEGRGTERGVSHIYSLVWLNFQPVLFGFIGAGITISSLGPDTVGFGVATVIIGLVARMAVAFLSLIGTEFNFKEQIYLQFSGIPKAVVQGALGPLALDTVLAKNLGSTQELYATQLMTISVLAIMIAAPIGAATISLTPNKLLKQSQMSNEVDLTDFDE